MFLPHRYAIFSHGKLEGLLLLFAADWFPYDLLQGDCYYLPHDSIYDSYGVTYYWGVFMDFI